MTPVAERVAVQRSRATAAIAERMQRADRHGAWAGLSYGERLKTAKRLLSARLRLNRAGLLRWRREGRFDD